MRTHGSEGPALDQRKRSSDREGPSKVNFGTRPTDLGGRKVDKPSQARIRERSTAQGVIVVCKMDKASQ